MELLVCLWGFSLSRHSIFDKVWGARPRGVARLHPPRGKVSEFLLIIARLPGLLSLSPLQRKSYRWQKAFQQKGSFTPEHGLAIPSHGAILPRLWARSRGLHSERCLSSITTDGGVCLKTSSGRASPSPGRRRCPAADSAVRPWSAVIIIKTRTPESPTRSVGFLSFLPPPPPQSVKVTQSRITSRVLEKLSIFSGIEQKLKSWQLVKSCGQSRASCVAVCQNQTKECYKRVLPVSELSWNSSFCMREVERGKCSFFYFKGAVALSRDYCLDIKRLEENRCTWKLHSLFEQMAH